MKEAKYKVGDRVKFCDNHFDNMIGTVIVNDDTWVDKSLKNEIRYTVLLDEENNKAWRFDNLVETDKVDEKYVTKGSKYIYAEEKELKLIPKEENIEALNTRELIRALETDIATLREVEEDIRLTEEKIKQLQNKVINRRQFLKDHIKRIAGYLK